MATLAGVIQSIDVDLNAYIKITSTSEYVTLPINGPYVAAGWAIFRSPLPGDAVNVIYSAGTPNTYICYTIATTNPAPITGAGNLWLEHYSGAKLRIMADGSVVIDAVKTVITGPLTVTGMATFSGGFSTGQGGLLQVADLKVTNTLQAKTISTTSNVAVAGDLTTAGKVSAGGDVLAGAGAVSLENHGHTTGGSQT